MARKSKKDTKTNGNGHAEATTVAPPPEGLPKDAKMLGAPFSQELPVENTEHQTAILGGRLADVILEKGRVEADKLAVQQKKKQELDELQERISDLDLREHELARDLKAGTHKAPVQCATYLIPGNVVRTVRLDSGATLDERTARAEDLQDDLFPPTLDGPKTDPAPEAAPEPPANDGTAITAPQDLLKLEQPAAPAGE